MTADIPRRLDMFVDEQNDHRRILKNELNKSTKRYERKSNGFMREVNEDI
jgi:hypothetical protein